MPVTFRKAVFLIVATLSALSAIAQKSSPPVKGFVKVDGKTIQVKHAIAVTGPAPFDDTQKVTYLFLTDKPISARSVERAQSVADLRKLMAGGIRVQLDDSSTAHLSIRHPSLGDDAITTGAGFGFKPTANGPDRYAGTLQSFGADRNEDEEMFGHKLRYDLAFDVSVSRQFPVTPKLALSPKAKKVGPGGGEPGKAYLANCAKASNLPKTQKEFEKMLAKEGGIPTDADLKEMSKERGKKVTREEALAMLFELVKLGSELAPKNCKVLGGGYDEKLAILQVEADVLGGRSRTDAILEKVDGAWTVTKHGTWTSVN